MDTTERWENFRSGTANLGTSVEVVAMYADVCNLIRLTRLIYGSGGALFTRAFRTEQQALWGVIQARGLEKYVPEKDRF